MLADALIVQLAQVSALTWRVIPHADGLDRVEARELAAVVFTTNVEAGPARILENTIQVWIVSGRARPGGADDVLDQGLDDMITALDSINPGLFQSAERGTFQDDNYAAWRVECRFTTQKGE